MNDTEKLALLTLKKIPNLGDSSIKKLIRTVGSADTVLKSKPSNLLKIDGIGRVKIKELHNTEHQHVAEAELRFVEENNLQFLTYQDQDYPDKLKHCLDGPVILFGRGAIDLKSKKILSIVGTRKVTKYGVSFCEELIEAIAPLNPVIISGFAYGVDITAQRAAIKHGLQTVGCLAHGLNQMYPKTHAKYIEQVEANGGFFTDFWSTDVFDRNNFLSRNRIIAGISEATIVIESADKGGSLVTAEIANSYNREVFAVPGRTTDALSRGCNTLIKTQRAHMLTSPADLLYMLNWEAKEENTAVIQKELFVTLEGDEERIYNFLTAHGKTVLDSIALQCSIPTYKLASHLLSMELKGVVKPLPGKLFEAV
ncbi:DNA-processing protein DprA [Aquimarina intermedia]|uniref:DNA processing protein n=1 Tax=Aquimarina intermedia TaxID=350814 RepID=A0A5S5CA57_9FLAO|nr:DNA-processing protein DprA [Aquimarina intermedia]TYP76301.1 DNA processing protein [Aquimarina intermedia]